MKKTMGKQEVKRKATEQRIIDAFEKVLRRDGIQKLGVNAVVKEAGVGKGLIYEYFGGLEGLVDAWVTRSHFIPDLEEIAGGTLEDFRARPVAQQYSDVNINYASYLRKTPLALEIYAEELQQRSSISKSMARVRQQIGSSHEKFFTEITPVSDDDDVALVFILQAASNYLALRSRTSPVFNGVDMSTEDGWQQLMTMIQRVVTTHALGKKAQHADSEETLPDLAKTGR